MTGQRRQHAGGRAQDKVGREGHPYAGLLQRVGEAGAGQEARMIVVVDDPDCCGVLISLPPRGLRVA